MLARIAAEEGRPGSPQLTCWAGHLPGSTAAAGIVWEFNDITTTVTNGGAAAATANEGGSCSAVDAAQPASQLLHRRRPATGQPESTACGAACSCSSSESGGRIQLQRSSLQFRRPSQPLSCSQAWASTPEPPPTRRRICGQQRGQRMAIKRVHSAYGSQQCTAWKDGGTAGRHAQLQRGTRSAPGQGLACA